jgi:hypothetical protein
MTDVLKYLNRHREPANSGDVLISDPLTDFLWADPGNIEECAFNTQRMTSCHFGSNGINRFLKLNNLQMLVRSHTACD